MTEFNQRGEAHRSVGLQFRAQSIGSRYLRRINRLPRRPVESISVEPLSTVFPFFVGSQGMPGFVWDQFETSLPMSTYLVAMLVADFVFIESPPELSNARFRIWARPEAISQAEYASSFFRCSFTDLRVSFVLGRSRLSDPLPGNVVLHHFLFRNVDFRLACDRHPAD